MAQSGRATFAPLCCGLPCGAVQPRLGVRHFGSDQSVSMEVSECPTTPKSIKRTHSEASPCSTKSTTCSSPAHSCSTPGTVCSASSPKQLRVCRFCLDTEEVPFEEEANTPAGCCRDAFVTPCPCRGSTKYVHLDCLVQHFVAQSQWHNFKCPTCRQPYEGRALRQLAEVSRARMIEDHGPSAPPVAHSLCYLAQAHAQLGNIHKAKELLEQGLEISEKHFGEGHVATAATLAELATVHGKLGDVQTQRSLLEKSLEIKEQHFGKGHINTAVTLNNLAAAYSEVGNVLQEKLLLEQSLQIKEKHYGKGHVQTTAALVNLAGVYSELGDVSRGLELLQWSLEIEERHFGAGHVETAITLNNLALACGESGDIPRMQECLLKCLSIKEQHFGSEHPELCLTLANLSMACALLGDEHAARVCCERALRVCEARSISRRYGIVMLRAASMHAALGEESLCSELGQGAVAVMREALGPIASVKVLELEGRRMARIWSTVGRVDIATRLRELCEQKECFAISESSTKRIQ